MRENQSVQQNDYFEEYEAAKNAALLAGDYLKKRESIKAESQEGKDIKLTSDKQSEKIIMKVLEPFGYSILSEEYGLKDNHTQLCWIIDPLDGTMNYLKGMDDLVCISIALYDGTKPILGVVYRFQRDELFSGLIGGGAYLNHKVIKPSNVSTVNQAVLATGFPVKRDYDTNSLATFISQIQKFKKVRMLGAAALMCSFVACGRLDVYMEEDIMLWDIAAASAIVKAAGGETVIEPHEDYKCLCICFANTKLMESYNA